jgi:hypothetical protein
MLDRFEKLYDDVKHVAAQNLMQKVTDNLPRNGLQQAQMMSVLGIYKDLLKPFKEATQVAQGSTYATLPFVARFLLPILCKKKGHLLEAKADDGMLAAEVKRRLLAKLEQYYNGEVLEIMYIAAYLDPLHVSKIKHLGVTDSIKMRALVTLECALDSLMIADNVVVQEGGATS